MESGQGDSPDGFVPISKFNDLLMRYSRLEEEYTNYQREAEARGRRAAHKIHLAKERIRAWQKYLDNKSAKKALRDAGSDIATPRALTNNEVPVSLAHPSVEAVKIASVSASNSPITSKITSSQTTQSEEAFPSNPPADSDDDVPVVVSARSLKRRRESPQGPQPPRVKQEQLSSSPLNSTSMYPSLLRTETSDLDLSTEQIRLRQIREMQDERLERLLRQNSIGAALNTNQPISSEQAFNYDPFLLQTPTGARRPGRVETEDEAANDLSQDHAPGSNSTVKTVKSDPGANTQSAAADDMSARATKSFGQQGTASFRSNGGPLHDLSPNTPTLPRTSAPKPSSTKTNNRNRSAAAIHALSEDGENILRSSKKPRTEENQDTPKYRGIGRLENLLDGSSPQIDKTVLSPRSAPAIRRHRETLEVTSKSAEKPFARPKRPIANTTQNNKPGPSSLQRKVPPNRPLNQKNNRTTPTDDPGPVLPEHEPLRCLPLHRLSLDSFKINPNYSENLGFAYRETIRKRDQRLCLPGCTRPECCGTIRKFVEAGGLPNAPPRRSTLFSDDDGGGPALSDDELTLQGYLGAAYAQTIHRASAAERREMLVEARAKAFADKHGKHRQVFERRTTPPGFWRTDMPTTQEMEEDREEARKMERQKVEERWRDAMRGGGRYVFRDE